MLIQTVALRDLKFLAYHGYYPEEQLTGSQFVVDVEATFYPGDDSENLQQTVNYEVIYQVVSREMQNTQKLLETVVKNILEQLLSTYSFLATASVGVKKINPPMGGDIGHSFVQLQYIKD